MIPKWFKRKAFVIPTTALLVGAVGGGVAHALDISQVNGRDQVTIARAWKTFEQNQPPPSAPWSQYRQTVIDVEQAQIHGVSTTTFGYSSIGAPKPQWSCPSVGFPVPTTSQLTNPQQVTNQSDGHGAWDHAVIEQPEPNGTFTGQSSGTYVTCVAPNGTPYVQYEEGYVHTVGGPAHFDAASGQVVLDGPPTVTTQSGQGH